MPTQNPTKPFIGKHCIVRTYSAGVHAGIVKSIDGKQVSLENSRRIWKWYGAFTLSEVSQKGIEINGSRVAMPVPNILLTEAIEIIPTTAEAKSKIEACHD